MRAKSRLGAGARRSGRGGRRASVHMLEQRLCKQRGLAPRLAAAGPGSAVLGPSTHAQQQNHLNSCHCLPKQRVRVPNLTAAPQNWLCQWDSGSQWCNINVTDKEQIVNWGGRRGMCLNRQIVNISASLLPDKCWYMCLASALCCTRLWISGREGLDLIAHAMNTETSVFRELLDSCLNCATDALQLVNLSSSVTLIAGNPSSGEFN